MTLQCIMCGEPVEETKRAWQCAEHGVVRAVMDAETGEIEVRPFPRSRDETDCTSVQTTLTNHS